VEVFQGAVGNFEAVEEEAGGCDLVEEDLGGDSEAAVDGVVVEDEGIGSVADGGDARADGVGAASGEGGANFYVVGVVVIDAAADNESAGKEMAVITVMVLCDGGSGGEGGYCEDSQSFCQRMPRAFRMGKGKLHVVSEGLKFVSKYGEDNMLEMLVTHEYVPPIAFAQR